jgi:hypothetical protein
MKPQIIESMGQLQSATEKIKQVKKMGFDVHIGAEVLSVCRAATKDSEDWICWFNFKTLSEFMVFCDVLEALIRNDGFYEYIGKLRK